MRTRCRSSRQQSPIVNAVFALVAEPAMLALIVVTAITGVVRGFSGFGAGMLFMPLAGGLYDPKLAIIILWLIDGVPTVPILVPAVKRCNWRDLIPLIVASVLAVPVGVYLLKTTDPVPVRWTISLLTVALVTMLWSGWRYRRVPGTAVTFGVGASSGFLSGFASLPGPPVLLFWMGGSATAAETRANIIVYFAFLTVIGGVNFHLQGLFSAEAVHRGLLLAPVYLASVLLGGRLFRFADEATFRKIAYLMMVTSAMLGLPLLDPLVK